MLSKVAKIANAIILIITGAFLIALGGIGAFSAAAPEPLVLVVLGVMPLAAGILIFAFRRKLWPVVLAWLLCVGYPGVSFLGFSFGTGGSTPSSHPVLDGITLLLAGLLTALLTIVVASKGETNTLATRREG
jgi:hypothetical protein